MSRRQWLAFALAAALAGFAVTLAGRVVVAGLQPTVYVLRERPALPYPAWLDFEHATPVGPLGPDDVDPIGPVPTVRPEDLP